ncbi:MAG TPA: LLM class flavin-dependent oxidoreductase, partial [Cytophagales bacterium]|nr:LLM class flavin-dependent oxidoreductase [Cytophagales bacterium]
IAAQAIATLLEMFPDRLEIALGSGEALNESITGTPWPEKSKRNERLVECYHIMTRLLRGEKVSHEGLVKVKDAQLYTRPTVAPKLMCAAITEETARWAGKWADGLLTIHYEESQAKKIIKAFRENGGEGKPMHVQMAISYARDEETAIEGGYDQWRSNILDPKDLGDLPTVEQFDAKSEKMTREDVKSKITISSDVNKFIDMIQMNQELGYSNIIIHNVNKDQTTFIDDFGAQVLPVFKRQTIYANS